LKEIDRRTGVERTLDIGEASEQRSKHRRDAAVLGRGEARPEVSEMQCGLAGRADRIREQARREAGFMIQGPRSHK